MRALKVHAIVAVALQFGVLIQAVAAVVQWRRARCSKATVCIRPPKCNAMPVSSGHVTNRGSVSSFL